MRNLPFNLGIAFLACFLMNFVTPAFSSPTPTATIIPTPTITATTTVTASITATPTPQPPTVTTGEAEVTCGPMPLNGTVNANGLSTTVWFEYGTDIGSYSGTSSTQTVFGMENTTVRIEIDVEYCGYVYNWCTGETTYFGSDYYYYRIVAQNSAGISYGNEKGVGRDCCLIGDNWDCTPSPSLTPTPVGLCIIVGTVIDALSTSPIAGATVSTDIGGFSATTDTTGSYTIPDVADGDYVLTASATGYDLSSQLVTVVDGTVIPANFALVPTLPTTPTVSPAPTPDCLPESISVSQSKLTLKRKRSKDVTVTVKGENDCLVDGETVTAKINNAGKKRISILPSSAVTNSNGEAKFTITAKRVGNTRVIFKAGILKNSIIVRVRR